MKTAFENDNRIFEIEQRLSQLPKGTLTYKKIGGKEQPYLQWTENGKSRSIYVKKDERERVIDEVKEREELRSELRELCAKRTRLAEQARVSDQARIAEQPFIYGTRFNTKVVRGAALEAMTKEAEGYKKRFAFDGIMRYLRGEGAGRVFLIYGLRRTGKTTMIRQAIRELSDEERLHACYIKIRPEDSMAGLDKDMERLFELGYRYVFIDEITLMEDFVNTASLLSDIYAMQGMKIVLSGTDSLGFYFASAQELYDRAFMLHTSFIPYREHSYLLGIDSIDDYIRYGGTLRMGENAFDDPELRMESVAFRDDESTRRYIDTAISRNIQHSLALADRGQYFRHLIALEEAGELTGAINRIIEDMNHRFLVRVLTDADRKSVSDRLREILEIRNKGEMTVEIEPVHAYEIKEYLKALDLISECRVETGFSDESVETDESERVIFTQPGMRYCQVEALIHVLENDRIFMSYDIEKREYAASKIREDVMGRMLEDMVLFETSQAYGEADRRKTLSERRKVFKYIGEANEIDMVVCSPGSGCELYEIKHSTERAEEQMRSLINPELCASIEKRYGRITGRYVLYRGKEENTEKTDSVSNNVVYLNVEEFLKNL